MSDYVAALDQNREYAKALAERQKERYNPDKEKNSTSKRKVKPKDIRKEKVELLEENEDLRSLSVSIFFRCHLFFL